MGKFLILLKSILIRYRDLRRIKNYDLVFIYREAVMFGSIWFEKKFKKAGAKIILDFDDAIWLMDISESNKNLKWLKKPEKTADIVRISDMVFVGNSFLQAYALNFNKNVRVVPTTIDLKNFTKSTDYKSNKKQVCIGWTGSSTTLKHFETIIPVLKQLEEKYADKIKIKLISDVNIDCKAINIDFCRWNKETEVHDLCELDIGIMPLPDDEWSKGKCGFKGLQYMSLEIPAVMSAVGVNTEIISDEVNGFLVRNEIEWIEKLSRLIDSEELRIRLGKSGRKTVEERFSFESQKQKYLDYFNELTGG